MNHIKNSLLCRYKPVLNFLVLLGFSFSIFIVQLAGISDHLSVNFSVHLSKTSDSLLPNATTFNEHSQSDEDSPFHQMHIHGNLHIHDFLTYTPLVFQTTDSDSKLYIFLAAHWLPYDYIESLLRPPSILFLV